MAVRNSGQQPVLAKFKEFPDHHREDVEIVYSLDEWHDVYVNLEDLTGYEAAIELVGTWKEWQRMIRLAGRLQTYIDEWNEEIKIRIKSRAIKNVTALIDREDSVGLSAAKWVSEEGWDKRKAGRPSKTSIKNEQKAMAQKANETEEDLKRVMDALQ